MKFDAQKALVVYSGALTAVMVGVLITGAARDDGPARFTEIDVERINVKEADGTLRMTISNKARFPEVIVRGQTFRHSGREATGMLFFNEEGTETGGLIWSGATIDGKRTSMGSLTFDRYEQDQTIQMLNSENGSERMVGFRVNDQPDGSLDFAALGRLSDLPAEQREAAARAANASFTPRAFLGRQTSGASELVLRDAAGKPRLSLSVAPDGAAKIDFLDANGSVTRTMTPEG